MAWDQVERQRQVRLRPGQVEELIAAYQGGSPLRELAIMFGVHESTVRGHLVRNGVSKRPYRRLRGGDLSRAKEMYENGESLRSIAANLGVSRETVRAALVAGGLQLRSRGGHHP